jgi:flavin-dependent dehydrogenase
MGKRFHSRYSGGGLGWGFRVKCALRQNPHPNPPPEYRERENNKHFLQSTSMREAVIIGAGPAGSLAALLLARAGWSATLVEQHRFPRDKVCGECLSALGIEVLRRHGLLSGILARGAVALHRAILHSSDGSSATIELPRQMLGVSRQQLDDYLLSKARSAGITVLHPARCEAIDVNDQAAKLSIRDLESNRLMTLSTPWAIIADGKGTLARRASTATGDFGIKSHWQDVDSPRDCIELFGCRGCYGGLAPIEEGRWNAAFSAPAGRLYEHKGNLDVLFAEFMQENPMLRRKLARATQSAPWLASPLPRFGVNVHGKRRLIPIGNAAAAIEPIGGEGMGLALRSAELAAEALVSGGGIDVDTFSLRTRFKRLWRAPAMAYRAGAIVASSRRLSCAVVPLLYAQEDLCRTALRAFGK